MAKDLIPLTGNSSLTFPTLFAADPATARRVLEFFAANIRNPHTRKAYGKAAGEFAAWCEANGISHLRDVQPDHVAAYVENLQRRVAAPSVKLQLAGIRMLFDWLVVGQVMPMNPAAAVRGPKHSVKKGKTPVLTADEARTLLDAIDTSSIEGLRDRASLRSLWAQRGGRGSQSFDPGLLGEALQRLLFVVIGFQHFIQAGEAKQSLHFCVGIQQLEHALMVDGMGVTPQ